ncbi:MAG: amino acid ABC transporter permease, partial [Candidatus Cellulosilyticum pullistercoris]|nr:amino acid ABC transporter permease [Candidatus Cellulosilyticum pullistercoris]
MNSFFTNLLGQQTVDFYKIFIEQKFYTVIWEGLKWTLGLTAIALAIGLMIGVFIALVQISEVRRKNSVLNTLGYYILKFLKWITSLYI